MDFTRFSPCCCSCRCDGCGVQPCGHVAEVRRSARVSLRTDSVTCGYRRLTHLRLVTAHAHDVLLVPLWLTVCVCSCRVGRRTKGRHNRHFQPAAGESRMGRNFFPSHAWNSQYGLRGVGRQYKRLVGSSLRSLSSRQPTVLPAVPDGKLRAQRD